MNTTLQTNKTKKLCFTAVCAALACAGTFVAVPLPIGYFNLGDIFVLCSAWCLGPVWGAAAAGVGTALADILMGYVTYAPATLIIKALVAVAAYTVFAHLAPKNAALGKELPFRILAAVAGEIIMVGGYFLFEALIMGFGTGALASVPGNCLQAACGVIGAVLLSTALTANKAAKQFIGMH